SPQMISMPYAGLVCPNCRRSVKGRPDARLAAAKRRQSVSGQTWLQLAQIVATQRQIVGEMSIGAEKSAMIGVQKPLVKGADGSARPGGAWSGLRSRGERGSVRRRRGWSVRRGS